MYVTSVFKNCLYTFEMPNSCLPFSSACGLVLAVLVSGSVAGCGGALEPAGLTNATAGSLLVLLPEVAITNKTLLVLDLNLLGPVAI